MHTDREFQLRGLFRENPNTPPSPGRIAQAKEELEGWLESNIRLAPQRLGRANPRARADSLKQKLSEEVKILDRLIEHGGKARARADACDRKAEKVAKRIQVFENSLKRQSASRPEEQCQSDSQPEDSSQTSSGGESGADAPTDPQFSGRHDVFAPSKTPWQTRLEARLHPRERHSIRADYEEWFDCCRRPRSW